MKLTKEQQAIVTHSGGHAKVSAVAGSGKTTTMVARVKHLLAQGMEPGNLLILMFNKSARDSFDVKLREALASAQKQIPEVRTFHSLGLRLTKSFNKRGVLPYYSLQTEEFIAEKLAKTIIGHIVDQGDGEEEWLSKENLEGFLTFVDLVKSTNKPVQDVFQALDIERRFDYFIPAFKLFEKSRKAQRIRFYADLIHEPVMAMLHDRTLSEWVANRVDHIIVDEYQDINEIQQQLLACIAGTRARVMVVGDVDQCIYEWRGAKPEYITRRFELDFKKAKTYTLSYTFRYGHRLSLAANHLISNNRMRDRKLCLSFPETFDTRVETHRESYPHPLLTVLKHWTQGGKVLRDCAVLVRMFAMSVPVELALLEAGIPYRLVGHEDVFECGEIKALTGFLQLCQGSLGDGDTESSVETIQAMLTNPHLGIKRDKIAALSRQIVAEPERAPLLIAAQAGGKMAPFLQKQVEDRAEMWHAIQKLPHSSKAHHILDFLIERGDLFSFYRKISTRSAIAVNKIKTCQAFVNFARRLDLDVDSFLSKISALQQIKTDPHKDHLLLTSIHRAKGLEWPLVVLPGLEDGVCPLLSEDNQAVNDSLEDERRLFYVAMTRAMKKVVCIHPPDNKFEKQKKAGSTHFVPPSEMQPQAVASRFLYEANLGLSVTLGGIIALGKTEVEKLIPAKEIHTASHYLQAIGSRLKPFTQRREADRRPSTGYYKINDLAEGVYVRSAFFGVGVVTAVLDRHMGKIEVLFEEHGKKNLVVDFARLMPV